MNIYQFKILRECLNDATHALTIDNEAMKSSYQSLINMDYLDQMGKITSKGLKAMEAYRVDNAIIMAAGMSSRFAPLSYERPKGLLNVRGEVLIERQIRQLHECGITDITIVLGYMKEQFYYLEDKYNVKIVVNDDYYRYNNTSTLMLVLDQLKNTYICSSDNYFVENVFYPYEYKTTYPVQVHTTHESGEYYADFTDEGLITQIGIGSGTYNCMVGHVFFDQAFSHDFGELLKQEYPKEETKSKLWEKVYVEHMDQFTMYAEVYSKDIIKEFDSLEELQAFDASYLEIKDSEIFNNIMSVLKCKVSDITGIVPVKDGFTNLSLKFEYDGKAYIYRHPGVGTDEYINRKSEFFAQQKAKELGFDDSYIYMNPEKGWKLSYFIDQARKLDYHQWDEVKQALEMIKDMHDQQLSGEFEFNIWNKSCDFVGKLSQQDKDAFSDFDELFKLIESVKKYADKDNVPLRLCHCDFYDPNILFSGNDLYLIDWEYAGVDDPGVDIGTFIACSDYTYEEAMQVLELYNKTPMDASMQRHFIAYIAIASYYWFVWAIFQESNGAAVGDYLIIWYNNSKFYGNKALTLYEETYENN